MHQRIVRFGEGGCAGGWLAVEPPFQCAIVQIIRQRPAQSGIRRQFQVLGDDALGNVERPSDGFKAQVGAMPVSEYVSYLAHG